MKSKITILLMFFTVILTGQGLLIIDDTGDCKNKYYNYDLNESEKIKTRFQKYVLKKSIDDLRSMSSSSQVDFFDRLYTENGNGHSQYMHSDSQYYSIPYNPICDLYNRYLIGYTIRKETKELLDLLIDNSEKITPLESYTGQKTKIRIWEFLAHREQMDNYVELEIDKQGQMHYSHYKTNYQNSMIDADPIQTQSGSVIIDEDLVKQLQSFKDMLSFTEIPNTYLRVVDGYYNIIEITDQGESNFVLYHNIESNEDNMWQVEKVRSIIQNINNICGLKLLN